MTNSIPYKYEIMAQVIQDDMVAQSNVLQRSRTYYLGVCSFRNPVVPGATVGLVEILSGEDKRNLLSTSGMLTGLVTSVCQIPIEFGDIPDRVELTIHRCCSKEYEEVQDVLAAAEASREQKE